MMGRFPVQWAKISQKKCHFRGCLAGLVVNQLEVYDYVNINISKLYQIDFWKKRILVYGGSDDKSILIGELFGTPNHRVVKSISSSGKSMLIVFRKQYSSNFKAEVVASIKYNKINPDCQSWLNNNILMSPNNPNINCSWIITRKFGSYITLDFKFIEVKQTNKY